MLGTVTLITLGFYLTFSYFIECTEKEINVPSNETHERLEQDNMDDVDVGKGNTHHAGFLFRFSHFNGFHRRGNQRLN